MLILEKDLSLKMVIPLSSVSQLQLSASASGERERGFDLSFLSLQVIGGSRMYDQRVALSHHQESVNLFWLLLISLFVYPFCHLFCHFYTYFHFALITKTYAFLPLFHFALIIISIKPYKI